MNLNYRYKCATCKGKRRVMLATIKPDWAGFNWAEESTPLPPFPGSGRSMYDFTETDCPDCTPTEMAGK